MGEGSGRGVAGRSIIGAIIVVITTTATVIITLIPGIGKLITQHLITSVVHHELHRHPRDGDTMPVAVVRGHPPSSCAAALALPGDGLLTRFDSSFSWALTSHFSACMGGVVTVGAHTGGGRVGSTTSRGTTKSITVVGIEDTVVTPTVGVTVSWVILSFVTVDVVIVATTAMVMARNPTAVPTVTEAMRTSVTVPEINSSENTENPERAATTTVTRPAISMTTDKTTAMLLMPPRTRPNPPLTGPAASSLVPTGHLIDLWLALSRSGPVTAGEVISKVVTVTASKKGMEGGIVLPSGISVGGCTV